MLYLCTAAAVLGAPTALQPQNSTADVVLSSSNYALTSTDKVFHIGANKAGTTSMWLFYSDLPGDWNPCHDMCGKGNKQWYTESSHKKKHFFEEHRVFMDNGDQADYEWLYDTFESSRFVMNLRGMRDWVVSRYDMVREIRLGGGCSAHGTHASCKGGSYTECAPQAIFPGHNKCLKSHLTWTGNSDADIRSWIVGLAHIQKQQLKFFKSRTKSWQRFVQADFTDDSREHDAIQRLWWINRKKLHEHKTGHLMTMSAELPTRPPIKDLPGPSSIPRMLSDPHPDSSKKHVEKVLKEAGCKSHTWDQRLYTECAQEIKHRGLELAELPNASFPSAHHWYIHKDELDIDDVGSLPSGTEIATAPIVPMMASPVPQP
jgi:hypothetical protein